MSKPTDDLWATGEERDIDVEAVDDGATAEQLMERIRMLHAKNADLAEAVAHAQALRRRRLH